MIRARFAPSPTGSLHIGGARTALYNYLFAKKNAGDFILRIEDTDQKRHIESSQFQQVNDLAWLGLVWDEGLLPDGSMRGAYQSYRQSERLGYYKQHVDQLLEKGKAFYCFLTDEQIDEMRDSAVQDKRPFQLCSPWRDLSLEQAKQKAESTDFTIRFRNDQQGTLAFSDLIRGDIALACETVGDFVLMRSGGMPVYNFSCVIDDHLMGITHVLRGEEHLPNTLKQMIIYQAFNWTHPQFGHLSVIVGSDRKKLSKRDDSVSILDFKSQGYLSEALINGMALLGWSHPDGQDIFSLSDLQECFDIGRLNAAPAAFDRQKLKWINAQYLRALSPEGVLARLLEQIPQAQYLSSYDKGLLLPIISLYQSNADTLLDLLARVDGVVGEFELSVDAKDVLQWPQSIAVLTHWRQMVTEKPEYIRDYFSDALTELKVSAQVSGKKLFMPLRVALIGQAQGAELKELVTVMPHTVMRKRVDACINWVAEQ